MINHIPTTDDFTESGLSFLNLAWSSTLGLMLKLDDRDVEASQEDDEIPDGYWTAAQKPLGVALGLTQQGAEMLLKAGIASISPYILIAGEAHDWPAGSHADDTSFSSFKTIDAHDLVRTFNTVSSRRLDGTFCDLFEKTRQLRNVVMHSVDQSSRLTAKDVLVRILRFYTALVENPDWVATRRSHLETTPDSIAYSTDHVDAVMVREFMKVLDVFEPAEMRDFFRVDKRQRFYSCYSCNLNTHVYGDVRALSAQLTPNTPESTTIHCFICGATSSVTRSPCRMTECPGNVIGEDGTCLTCDEAQT